MRGEERYQLFFETLANELRVRMLKILLEKERTVGQLAEEVDEEQSKISHALSALKLCKLVTVRTDGTKRYYRANERFVRSLFSLVDEHVCNSCDACDKILARQMKVKGARA